MSSQTDSQTQLCQTATSLTALMATPDEYISGGLFGEMAFAEVFEMIEPADVAAHIEACAECGAVADQFHSLQSDVEDAKAFEGDITAWSRQEVQEDATFQD